MNDILPESFAVVKETASRFKENETITATATQHDRDLSVKRDYITIEGEQVHFKNSWLASQIVKLPGIWFTMMYSL